MNVGSGAKGWRGVGWVGGGVSRRGQACLKFDAMTETTGEAAVVKL